MKGGAMKPFDELTYLGQIRRLRALAFAALDEFSLQDAHMRLVQHGENTSFRVEAPAATSGGVPEEYHATRYLLRVHRPGYQTTDTIKSELTWLAALRDDANLPVPQPIPAPDGSFLVTVAIEGVPGARVCSLLRWMKGRKTRTVVRPDHFAQLGRLMASLHEHASHWTPPPAFARRHWDWDGLFGDNAGFRLSGEEVWSLLPSHYADLFEPVAARIRNLMKVWGKSPDRFGLIHADLLLGGDGNVLFSGGEARAIDFDDCGYGYWVYDLATALSHWQMDQRGPAFKDALLSGYATVRPFPERQLAQLDLFMAARHVSEILWAVDIAQTNPRFAQELDGWMAWAGDNVRRLFEARE
jgi:Ser/Thr protein kinase RdoA (MazF antagonist)